jgi:hypothetical protein
MFLLKPAGRTAAGTTHDMQNCLMYDNHQYFEAPIIIMGIIISH